SRECRGRDRTVDRILPETALLGESLQPRGDTRTPAAEERGELSDARGKQRFDPLTDAAREDGRCPAGADGDDHFAAIDDRRHDEGGEFGTVDDVDRERTRLRPNRDFAVERLARGGDDG